MNRASSHQASGPPAPSRTRAQRLRIAPVMPPWPDLPRQAWGGIEPLAADLTAALEYGGQDQGGAHGSEQGGYQN